MKYLALAALVCVPIAATVGYVAHRDPPPPTFAAYLADTQGIKHVPGDDTDEWLAVAATGPNKGGAMEVTQALSFFPTHQALEQSAQGKVVYVETKCANYAAGKVTYSTPVVVRKCSSEKRTRKQAESYMRSLLAPEPKS